MTTIALGDLFGFVAILLIIVTALFMVFRGKILKLTRNLVAIRGIHIAISTGAGLFLILHVLYYISWGLTTGILVGYAAFVTSIVVWVTGMAFFEKVRDSLLFHSALAIGLISLVLIHAASTSGNIPIIFSEIMIITTIAILLANVVQQMSKLK